jgi:small subunit ribosomal protein S6
VYYETIFIVSPDVSKENTEKFTDDLVTRAEKAGGRIVKREYWGARELAYSIAKRKRGHYMLLVTDGEPKAAAALEEGLKLDERVLRFLTTRLQEMSEEPSPLLRRRPRRESTDKPDEAGKEKAAAVSTTDKPAEEPAQAEKTDEARTEEAVVENEAEETEAGDTGKDVKEADAETEGEGEEKTEKEETAA